ncbi:myb/SANT-like DNA-binding domain-containing protein 4 [Saccostrea cucullata]|uniref:myb/SANT-like DNA-binding domain-containing protein 4 n=1 Tax=Saccostrea cuccullata TaxID=36930 RepID=UPI002ED29473
MKILTSCVIENKDVLFAKLSASVTNEKKKAVWEDITKQINSSSALCKRETEEIKKKWKDARSIVKKKEASRKYQTKRTGGGPPPESVFKAWELDILSIIPDELISGIDGGVDTAFASNSETNNLASSCTAVPSEISAGIPSLIVEEVDVPEEAPSVHVSGPSTDKFFASTLYGSKRKDTASDPDAEFMLNLIGVKERRAIAEERKADALERIAAAFENKFGI